MNHIRRFSLLAVLAALVVGCAWGQAVIKVSYSLVPTPEAMKPSSSDNIGVLVIVQTAASAVPKLDVHLAYADSTGTIYEVSQTVSRAATRGGFDPNPIPVLFVVPVVSVVRVFAEGYTPSLTPQEIIQ